MDVKAKLEKEIAKELDDLAGEDIGSDSHTAAVESISKLLGKYSEMEKIEVENANKVYMSEKEHDLKLKQIEDERKDRIVKNILTVASIASGIGVTVWGTLKSFKFEETGTVTTIMGRGFLNNISKFLPKK